MIVTIGNIGKSHHGGTGTVGGGPGIVGSEDSSSIPSKLFHVLSGGNDCPRRQAASLCDAEAWHAAPAAAPRLFEMALQVAVSILFPLNVVVAARDSAVKWQCQS